MKKLLFSFILCLVFYTGKSQNTWSTIASFGGGERERAIAFVIGSRAYVGTGIDSANICKSDLWEYDPGTNSWTQKANVPGSGRRCYRICYRQPWLCWHRVKWNSCMGRNKTKRFL
ncbi:MAG: hypothetical protein IPL12_00140 [Bacteroidetes bacterium]|nr:hypothetical protein [Bacteroidota bacterium]